MILNVKLAYGHWKSHLLYRYGYPGSGWNDWQWYLRIKSVLFSVRLNLKYMKKIIFFAPNKQLILYVKLAYGHHGYIENHIKRYGLGRNGW